MSRVRRCAVLVLATTVTLAGCQVEPGPTSRPGTTSTGSTADPSSSSPAAPDAVTVKTLRALAAAAAREPDRTSALAQGGYLHVLATTRLHQVSITASSAPAPVLRTKEVWTDWSGSGYQQYTSPGDVSLTQRVTVPQPSLAHLTPAYCATLPTDPTALRDKVAELSGGTTSDPTVLAAALLGLLSSQQLTPPVQAAVIQLLSVTPGVTAALRQLDGADVVLVAAPDASGQERAGVFLDRRTGRVVGQEAWTSTTTHTTTVATDVVAEVPQSVVDVAEK